MNQVQYPNAFQDELAKLFARRAAIHEKNGESEMALNDLAEAIAMSPRNPRHHQQRGKLHLKLNQYFLAADDYANAYSLDSHSVSISERFFELNQLVQNLNSLQDILSEDLNCHADRTGKINFSKVSENDAITLTEELAKQKPLDFDDLVSLFNETKKVHFDLPNIVNLNVDKLTIVGDTHGQFQDVLNIFHTLGYPSEDRKYLFNGDFVDRGSQGLEIVIVLCVWKLAAPKYIFLNRGNHETDAMNLLYGFETECTEKYNSSLFGIVSDFFCSLPLGHVINKTVLVVHGGLFSDDGVTIDLLNSYDRKCQIPDRGPLNDVLWADPQIDNGRRPSPRGSTSMFGPDITEQFLKENNLKLLIRSHQMMINGYLVQHNGMCITVFSAPNYVGYSRNLGAVVHLSFDEEGNLKSPAFQVFEAQPIPVEYPPMKYAKRLLNFLAGTIK